MTKLLVLASEPISAQQLRAAMPSEISPQDAEVMVIVPALQENALRFWLSDADEAISRADRVRRATMEELGESGVSASGDVGESDPLAAIEDALNTFPADRIVLFTHPDETRRYREDLDEQELRARFGVPVDSATVDDSSD